MERKEKQKLLKLVFFSSMLQSIKSIINNMSSTSFKGALILISFGALIFYSALFGRAISYDDRVMVLFLASVIIYAGSAGIYMADYDWWFFNLFEQKDKSKV